MEQAAWVLLLFLQQELEHLGQELQWAEVAQAAVVQELGGPFLAGRRKLLMAATLAATSTDPALEIRWPRNLSLGTAKTHLVVFSTMPAF